MKRPFGFMLSDLAGQDIVLWREAALGADAGGSPDRSRLRLRIARFARWLSHTCGSDRSGDLAANLRRFPD